jgi:altronate hydrolase
MKPILTISDRDNVATALQALGPGRRLEIQERGDHRSGPIPSGHKVALRTIAAGEAVISTAARSVSRVQ